MPIARREFLAMAGACAAATACSHVFPDRNRPVIGGVKRLSPALDAIVAPDATVEALAAVYKWAEGPVWVREGGYLLFSDVPANTIHRWSRARGAEPFLSPSGLAGEDASIRERGANGLAIDAAGRLVMCDSGSRALARLDLATKRKEFLAERFQGRRFNSPNDLAIARSGAVYFTDPSFGLVGLDQSPVKELAFNGVFRWMPNGALTLIDDTLEFPNGIALLPDETTLYVSNCTDKNPVLKAYRLGTDGLPVSAATLFDAKSLLAPDAPGWPDGIKIDAAGNIFMAGPGGILILSAAGELLGVIGAGRTIANCAFGEDGQTLFLTAKDTLARVRLRTRGGAQA
jgi:gluconolactonase